MAEVEIAAWIGIDWADKEHAWALQCAGGGKLESGKLKQQIEAIEEWVGKLVQRFGQRKIAVAIEQCRVALIFQLSKYSNLIIYPIPPGAAAHYRQCRRPSGAKDDPGDAHLWMDYLQRHRDQLRPLELDTEQTRTLQILVEKRRRLVGDQTRNKQRLIAQLKLSFPQMLEWFSDVGLVVVSDLLSQWASLEDLQQAKPRAVQNFCNQHAGLPEDWTAKLATATVAVQDGAIREAGRLQLRCLAELMTLLRRQIHEFDQVINRLAKAHPDFVIIDSFPAAGPVMAPRLIAALGSQRQRWDNAAAIQSFSGIAPVTNASGERQGVHYRWACPKFLRQSFQEWAALTIQQSDWAAAFYRQRVEDGQSHHAVVRALAFKWIRILYRCWKDRVPYEESKYLGSRRPAPQRAQLMKN